MKPSKRSKLAIARSIALLKKHGYVIRRTGPNALIQYDGLPCYPVVTIAHYINRSRQLLDEYRELQSNIDERLRDGMKPEAGPPPQ